MIADLQPSTERATCEGSICLACSEGHHEQALLNEHCSCPCHGTATLNFDSEVAA